MMETLGRITGHLVVVGYGSVARGTLPLVLERFSIDHSRVFVVAPPDLPPDLPPPEGVHRVEATLTEQNFAALLTPYLKPKGSFLLNLSTGVSSIDLIRLCRSLGALYLDTCCEPWEGFYNNPALSKAERSNYRLRQDILDDAQAAGSGQPTALICMGANPGIISILVKRALLELNRDLGLQRAQPHTQREWAELAHALGVQGIHIAERDTQFTQIEKQPHEFVNTWSVEGFIGEGIQPAELGWGTFEPWRPEDAHEHARGKRAALYLDRPGVACRVWSWTPLKGPQLGFLITHHESIALAEYLSVEDNSQLVYRPTVHYAYHPCDDAVLSIHELLGDQLVPQSGERILGQEIERGTDALGVLLYGHKRNAFWYGSLLSIDQARAIAPLHNATGLQVAAGILAGMEWVLTHPHEGVVEAERLDLDRAFEVAAPYLGELRGVYTDWTPLHGRSQELLGGQIEAACPWAFRNILFPY